jgi:hypothetical protein
MPKNLAVFKCRDLGIVSVLVKTLKTVETPLPALENLAALFILVNVII